MSFLNQIFYYITAPIRALFSSPMSLFSAPKRLLGLSLPTRVALLVEIFLLIVTIVAYITFLYDPQNADSAYWLSWQRVVPIVLLLIVIPFVVRHAVKLWLEGEVSTFPDIDFAWREGVAALQSHGLDITEIPLFLVLGTADDRDARDLFGASQLSLRVHDVPEGPAALHWYASPDAIFLVCTQAGRMSLLAHKARASAGPATTGVIMARPKSSPDIRGTIVAGGGDIRGTAANVPAASAPAEPSFGGGMDIRGTMVAGGGGDSGGGGGAAHTTSVGSASLTAGESNEQSDRLTYVCQLLRRARSPFCPANGILTLLPFEFIQRGIDEGNQVQRAAKADLDAVLATLKLRCPVTALVAGMESESGFRELVRRVGPDRAKAQRFGKGFDCWNLPSPEQVEAVAAHACGAFEDWAYSLFREKGGLAKKGNTKLYALLCKIRSHLRTRLVNILVSGYAIEPEKDDEDGLLFSGCYFAATGETEDRQAFVKSVFEKLFDQENELDWTVAALEEDARYRGLANMAMAFSGLMLIALVGMLGYKFWPK